MVIHSVLCEIIKNNKILLKKKPDVILGEGRWNGVWDKLQQNESPETGAVRKVLEETGLKIFVPVEKGILYFYYGKRYQVDLITHVFFVDTFSGLIKSAGEGDLHWFKIEEIPYEEMWPDNKHWFPMLFDGKKFEGRFYYDEKMKKILDFNLREKL